MATDIQAGGNVRQVDPARPPKGRKRNYRWTAKDSAARFEDVGKMGSKRYQRFLNKTFLIDQERQLDAADYNIFVHCCTPFTQLWEEPQKLRVWEPFIDVTEERQEELLLSLSVDISNYIQNMTEEANNLGPSASFKIIDRKIRKLLKRHLSSEFLMDLDDEIVGYIRLGDYNSLVYSFSDTYHRMICHGICQFYALQSRSKNSKGDRIVVVSKTEHTSIPNQTLSQHLQKLKLRL